MEIAFTFNDVALTPQQRSYVEKKVTALERLLTRPERATVDIDQDKRHFYVVKVHVYDTGRSFLAEEVAETPEAAVDLVEDKLKEQIRDADEKRRALELRGARSIKKKTVIDDAARF